MSNKEIYIQSISVAAYSRNKGCTFRQKAERRRNTLICMLDGQISVKTKDSTYSAVSGDLLYIPAATASVTSFMGDSNRFVNFFFSGIGNITDATTRFSGSSMTAEIIQEAERQCLANNGSPLYYLSALYGILYELEKQSQAVPEPRFNKLMPILRRIEQHPEENRKVSEYSSEIFMCETGFRRLFRKYTGKSPIEYRNDIRLQRIESLVLAGETVANAATALGFQSVSFYYRYLKSSKNRLSRK